MNAVRGRYYSRLDAQIDKNIQMHGKHLVLYDGAESVLNRPNFLCKCGTQAASKPVAEEESDANFPNIGVRFIVH